MDGVASMAGNITNEVIGKLGIKNLSKGVKVDVLEGVVTVSLALNLKYDYSIMEVTKKVQEKVKNAVENMTGLEVADVNIKVAAARAAMIATTSSAILTSPRLASFCIV